MEIFQKNDYKASQVEVPSINPVSCINLPTLDMEDTRYAGDMDLPFSLFALSLQRINIHWTL